MQELRAAFGEADITPRLGTMLAGWIVPLRPAEAVRDPIQAHIALLRRGEDSAVVVGLDILSIPIADALDLRSRISRVCGVPASSIMVAASHSHTGPAVANLPITPADLQYVERMKREVVGKAAELNGCLVPARLGHGCGFEGNLSFNRRYIRRDGIVRTHPTPADPEMVCAEGPIDAQLGVLCARDEHGKALGYLVNFACHPCFYGGLNIVSANYPGAINRALKRLEGEECVTVFLNGACGDIHHANPTDASASVDMETMGSMLGRKAYELALNAAYSAEPDLKASSVLSEVPLRKLTEVELDQARRQAAGEKVDIDPRWQRFGPDDVYARSLLDLDRRYRESAKVPFEIQALRLGGTALVAIPAELFVWNGMRIKTASPLRPTYIVTCANGMIGYVATAEAYDRGGYEVTPCIWSKVDRTAAETIIRDSLKAIAGLAL